MARKHYNLPIALVSLAGVLAFFSLKAPTVVDETPTKPYDPNQTDVFGYSDGLRFAEEDPNDPKAPGLYLVLNWWKVVQMYLMPSRIYEFNGNENPDGSKTEERVHSIDILDARKHLQNPSLDTNGFKLVNLKENNEKNALKYEPTNWNDKQQVDAFYNHVVIPQLKTLYPNAKRFETAKTIIRGRRLSAPPALGAVHTDFSLDMRENDRFVEEYGAEQLDGKYPIIQALHGVESYRANKTAHKERHGEVLEAIVTFWRPIEMTTPVCDKPLMFMDASTYPKEDERQYYLHFDLWPLHTDHSLNALPVYRPEYQKWYYFPFMTMDEAAIFVQHDSRKGFFRVPHASFVNDNCPPGTEPRHSIDFRVMIFSDDL